LYQQKRNNMKNEMTFLVKLQFADNVKSTDSSEVAKNLVRAIQKELSGEGISPDNTYTKTIEVTEVKKGATEKLNIYE
jgi:hypothetical protein